MKKSIRVLIVDDSAFFREALNMHLSRDEDIEVVGESPDTEDAIVKIEALMPDVITLDIEMPGMNGIEFLKRVMPRYIIPAVVVSSVNGSVFDALSAGAVDFVPKPDAKARISYDFFINELKEKIKVASKANRSILKSRLEKADGNAMGSASRRIEVIAIGASTGGTEAIYEIVKSLPKETPGIVIVQHMPPVFTKMYAERLNNSSVFEVKEAETGDIVCPGRILVAPGDFQLRIKKTENGYIVDCSKEEKVGGSSPSIDAMLLSLAENAGNKAVGILLTGMGSDGAKGLLAMRENGAVTIGQDESSSIVYGMAKAAYNIGAVEKQLPLSKISDELLKILNQYK